MSEVAATEIREPSPQDVLEPTEAAEERGWFVRLAKYYVRRWRENHAHAHHAVYSESPHARAKAAITRACILSAITGASSGAISTGAALFTAGTEGIGALIGIPAAVLAIGSEAIFRSMVHVELTCELADIFGVQFDPDDPRDFWRLYALIFKTHEHEDEGDDPGRKLVHEISHVEGEEIGSEIGRKIMGESVARNVIPFVGIGFSAISNFTLTKRLGDTVRRYMRYHRAVKDTLARHTEAMHGELDLLIEGTWFIFTADGRLSPEETALLAGLLNKLDDSKKHEVMQRFVEDELDWTEKIGKRVPEESRDAFLTALEVIAAVDKEVSVPERKILRRAAHALGRHFDMKRVEAMIRDLEEDGVLATPSRISHTPL